MKPLRRELLDRLLEAHNPPCISIYMPVSPAFPGELENEPRFHNLLRDAERQLRPHYPALLVDDLIQRCRGEFGQREFWNHRRAALALFCSPDFLMTVDLPRPLPEMAIVADTFHTKPLLLQLETTGRFQVLCLTRKDVRLLESDYGEIIEVPLKNMPRTIHEAYDREDHLQPTPLQPIPTPTVSTRQRFELHLPGDVKTGSIPLERWFRIVDKGIWENHSQHDRLPLILCSVEENHALFRGISKNPFLQPHAIDLEPNHAALDRIRDEANRIIEAAYHDRTRSAIDNFRAAVAHHVGDDDPLTVARSAAEGRVALLLVEADRKTASATDPGIGDLLDDTAETVLKRGGQVLVIPPELMPTHTGLAAVYRY